MDPCPFLRVFVGNLALKVPVASKPARSAVHPSSTPCFCKIRIANLPGHQTAPIALLYPDTPASNVAPDGTLTLAATFDLSKSDLGKLLGKPSLIFPARRPCLKVSVYTGKTGASCGVKSGRLLGKVAVPLDFRGAESRPCVLHTGWIKMGRVGGHSSSEVHFSVRSEPDPRFVFEFGDEPECSPQVFQVQGSMRQPVFTCKFSCRSQSSDRIPSLLSGGGGGWLGSFGSGRERSVKERKGWTVTVHDLSGSPVALASMVTPFVASPASDRVSRSNPGAWLVLQPGNGTWKPWGRLEAWRVRGGISDGVGCRFELLPDATNMSSAGVFLSESTLSTSKGGKFTIDLTGSNGARAGKGGGGRSGSRSTSPGCSPRCGSGRFSGGQHFGHGLWPAHGYRGFVMSSTVGGEGKCSKPAVEIGVQNVGCAEDAAAFIALAAAVDLSMDACRLFSCKLRKELSQHQDFLG